MRDRYEVLREIGRGGFSVVYLARDRVVDGEVALKLLAPPPAARLAHERLRREVQIVRGLSHPNIVPVYDLLEESGRSCLVMEYIAGPDLEARVRERGPLDADEVARIGRDVAAALAHAHRRAILHRDVKPSNILLAPDGRARLTDFGAARLEGQATITQASGLPGTIAYAAPEVFAGRRGDARADLYALGLALYYALAGRLPERPSPYAPPPARPEGHRPRAVRAAVPGWLDGVVGRSTAADPGRRYAAAALLAAALESRAPQEDDPSHGPAAGTCALCGSPDPFGLEICPACVAIGPAADTLVVLARPADRAARLRAESAVAHVLGPAASSEQIRDAVAGVRPLARAPYCIAEVVAQRLGEAGAPTRLLPARRASELVPVPLALLTAAAWVVGTLAGLGAAPPLLWTSPAVALGILGGAWTAARRPVWRGRPSGPRLHDREAAIAARAFAALPDGAARRLLGDLVRHGRSSGAGAALEGVLTAGCAAAAALARLEADVAAVDAGLERDPARRLDIVDRGERSCDALTQRLLEATTSLARLRVEAGAAAAVDSAAMLDLVRHELEVEARLHEQAVAEVAAVLGEARPEAGGATPRG